MEQEFELEFLEIMSEEDFAEIDSNDDIEDELDLEDLEDIDETDFEDIDEI